MEIPRSLRWAEADYWGLCRSPGEQFVGRVLQRRLGCETMREATAFRQGLDTQPLLSAAWNVCSSPKLMLG